MELVRQELCTRIMMMYKNYIKNPMLLINMDEIAYSFNSPSTRTVHTKDDLTVLVNVQDDSLRVKVALLIAMNGTKVHLS